MKMRPWVWEKCIKMKFENKLKKKKEAGEISKEINSPSPTEAAQPQNLRPSTPEDVKSGTHGLLSFDIQHVLTEQPLWTRPCASHWGDTDEKADGKWIPSVLSRRLSPTRGKEPAVVVNNQTARQTAIGDKQKVDIDFCLDSYERESEISLARGIWGGFTKEVVFKWGFEG